MNIISAKRHMETLDDWLSSLKEFQLDSIFDTQSLGRSYECIKMLQNIQISKNQISATIIGSSEYKLSISDHDQQIVGLCTCPLEKNCKHLAALILSQMNIKY